jgi:2-oxoisovalerate dehydrogenase E2 component (dihydrolipoyl transacylase)
MARTTLKMPQLGESVTEGTVERWLKAEGDMVRRDEPIVEVVTDKVNAEIPSPFEGRLVRINVAEGQTVAIGAALAELEVEGATTTAAEVASPKAPASAPSSAVRATTKTSGDKVSPAVRRQAHLARQAAASGGGTAAAVPAPATRARAPGAREELVKVSAVRRQIAEHMVRSVSTSPHAWSLREVDVTRLVEYREAHKEDFQARHGFPLSYVPFFIQIVCDALLDNPYLNSTWTDEGIVLKHYVNMGIAVALPMFT